METAQLEGVNITPVNGSAPVFEIKNLSFTYPEQMRPALRDLSLSVQQGEFLVLCGPSGCGKSTLLRQLKTAMTPHGERTGEILFEGQPLHTLDARTESARIGFVQQSPENQIVTDKVWHELAFGLESLGYDTPTIRSRVAEMASFFGIETWYYKNVTELSGGQKQLLNLASVMVMQPSVLILDEPTSQLDPIAASEFLAAIAKINRELGTAVILTEHRLEEVFPDASRVVVMEAGRVIAEGTPGEVGLSLKHAGHAMFLAMPTAMRIWAAVENDAPAPVTVREGRNWLAGFAASHTLNPLPDAPQHPHSQETALSCSEVWFKYGKEFPDVVRGLSLEVKKGEFIALLGGNGTGKSTSMKLLSGILKPYRGECTVYGSIGVLPQNPQTLFVKKTVREDLREILREKQLSAECMSEKLARVTALCRLTDLLDRHPYDISGGEQQRAALAKVLLHEPEILFLDEPTKGLDAEFKQEFAQMLQQLLASGVTIFMVSHDIEFCARYAHRCALFFDGNIVTEERPREFFSGNSFYTTSANRMVRDLVPEAVTPEDVIAVCGGTLPPMPELPMDIPSLPESPETSASAKPAKLPLWRRLLGLISGLGALACAVVALGFIDLNDVISSNGISGDAARYLACVIGAAACLLVLAFSVMRKSVHPAHPAAAISGKQKLSKRTVLAAVFIILLIPATLFLGLHFLSGKKYYFISLMILLETMLPFFLVFEGRKPQPRELVIIAVLCAVGVAGRAAFFMLPNFKPVMAIAIIAGVAFGGETGFLVGSITMLTSNMLFSQGPWTPWQMFAMGLIGFIAGVLFRKGLLRRNRLSLCVFGALSSVVIFGGIMNPASAIMWAPELNWKIFLTYYITGFPMDCVQAAATWIFLWFAGEPILEKLDRIKIKYGLLE